MAISVDLTVSPEEPAHGDTVTATYEVAGNVAVASQSATLSGVAHIGGQDFEVSTTITLPGSPALPESFDPPIADGLTFTESPDDPAVFTAEVP